MLQTEQGKPEFEMLIMTTIEAALQFLATLFVFCLGLLILAVIVMFVMDRSQTHDAIRRNYPVIGRFRELFSELGEFFRQYFFAMDREEMPFNRAQRDWVERASESEPNTLAFGSTRNLTIPGTPIFVNDPYPEIAPGKAEMQTLVIGPNCPHPYQAPSFFNISGMSYGALSRPAVEALSKGAAKAGIWLNTGEGGLSDYHLAGGCDLVFQIGTARYGVRDSQGALSDDRLREIAAIEQVRMFELKLSQGAKPGKGGILPAGKVTPEIAAIRGIPVNQASISPNRHPDIPNNAALLDRIEHIRRVTGKPVGIKMVLGDVSHAQAFFAEIQSRGESSAPDFIALDSGDGGTGAAPMPLMDLVGMTIRESLPQVVAARAQAGLQDRIRLIVSGKLIVPGDVAWALACGADFVASARGFMFSLGCIQALKCNKNTCPTGITTHDKGLQKGLVPVVKAERVAAYAKGIIKDVEVIAHSCGVGAPRQLQPHHVRIVQPDGHSVLMSQTGSG